MAFDPAKHPRVPKGKGDPSGEFTSKSPLEKVLAVELHGKAYKLPPPGKLTRTHVGYLTHDGWFIEESIDKRGDWKVRNEQRHPVDILPSLSAARRIYA